MDEAAQAKLTGLADTAKEDEASQASKDAVNHDDGGQCQPGDQCDDPEYSKHQDQECADACEEPSHDSWCR
jgi:hypothetical protein